MTEKAPGRAEIKEFLEASKTEVKERDINIASRKESLEAEEQKLAQHIQEVRGRLGSLVKEAEELGALESDLGKIEEYKGVWERVATMRDYGAAIESGDVEKINEAAEAIRELVDGELTTEDCEVILNINSAKETSSGVSVSGNPSSYDYHKKLGAELNEAEKRFVHQRVEAVLKLWAEGKIGYAQDYKLVKYEMGDVQENIGRGNYGENLKWDPVNKQDVQVIPLSQYTPPLLDMKVIDSKKHSFLKRTGRNEYNPRSGLEHEQYESSPAHEVQKERIPEPMEQIFGTLVRGAMPRVASRLENFGVGDLVDTNEGDAVIAVGYPERPYGYYKHHLEPTEKLYDRYGVEFYTDTKENVEKFNSKEKDGEQ